MYKIITESGRVIKEGLNESGADRFWESCNGIWEDENGEEYIYIKEM